MFSSLMIFDLAWNSISAKGEDECSRHLKTNRRRLIDLRVDWIFAGLTAMLFGDLCSAESERARQSCTDDNDKSLTFGYLIRTLSTTHESDCSSYRSIKEKRYFEHVNDRNNEWRKVEAHSEVRRVTHNDLPVAQLIKPKTFERTSVCY